MFDEKELDKPVEREKDPLDIEQLSTEQLLDLRGRIQARLPGSLADVDLERELVLQLTQGQQLMSKILSDPGVPANQRAQVINSCSAILDSLTKRQNATYTSERMKRIEQILIKVVRKHLSAEAQAEFFEAYEMVYSEPLVA
jgi:hypothetical protein